jgi:hypothetical protein
LRGPVCDDLNRREPRQTFRQNDKSFSPRARLLQDPERQEFACYLGKLLPTNGSIFVRITLSLIGAIDRQERSYETPKCALFLGDLHWSFRCLFFTLHKPIPPSTGYKSEPSEKSGCCQPTGLESEGRNL